MGRRKKNSGLLAAGIFVILIAVTFTVLTLSPQLKLFELATVSAGPVTVSGLSEGNAMVLGGIAIITWIIGPLLIAKGR